MKAQLEELADFSHSHNATKELQIAATSHHPFQEMRQTHKPMPKSRVRKKLM
jgi:hypothetical protein